VPLLKQSMTCSVHSHCGTFVYNCLLEAHLHPGAHCIHSLVTHCGLQFYVAPRSFLSQSTKWLVHFLSSKPLSDLLKYGVDGFVVVMPGSPASNNGSVVFISNDVVGVAHKVRAGNEK